MVTITTGLRAIQLKTENPDRPSVRWFKISDGASVKVRFLDDLDESTQTSENGAGIAVMLEEHAPPGDYRSKAACTREEGECFACQKASEAPKTGWHRRSRVYVNVLVDDGIEDPYVAVWSMGIFRSTVFETLKDSFLDEGSIANRNWRIKRSGSGMETTYIMRDMGEDSSPFDFTAYDRVDFEKVIRQIPYAEQEAFYITEPPQSKPVDTEEW